MRYDILREIRRLDPEQDHQRIMHLSTCWDFPWDTTRALELALFRTFGVPSIAGLLDQTGEFCQRTRKRYDDTDLIVSEMVEHGYDSERGRRALRRMNQIHGRFRISNSDYLYVLSTFILEPIRWNERFGWRPLCEQERQAYYVFWREVGTRMGICEIPASLVAYDQFNRHYEKQHFRYTPANQRVGSATRELFVSWFPYLPRELTRLGIYALMDEALLRAFGFPSAPRLLRWTAVAALKLRARALRFFPPRRKARLRTGMARPTYPEGYQIEQLGPAR